MIENALIVDDLKRSGLSVDYVATFGWREITERNKINALKSILGFSRYKGQNLAKTCNAFLVIPYPRKEFGRVRLYPPIENVKYLQPKGVSIEAFIPPSVWEIRGKANKPIIITEGEKKTLCLLKQGYNAIGLSGVWCFKNRDGALLDGLQEFDWKRRTVHIVFDSDAFFNAHVRQAEMELAVRLWALGAIVRIVRLLQPNHSDKYGVDDYIVTEGLEMFQKVLRRARPLEEAYSVEYRSEMLAALRRLHEGEILTTIDLQLIAKALMKKWKTGWQTIVKEVSKEQDKNKENSGIVEVLEPFNGEVDGAELAKEVEQILQRHVIIPDAGAYVAATLWVFLTYVFGSFNICPMLLITSPTKRCGKTTLIETLEGLTYRALVVSNLTPAAVFRVIDKYAPTLLADEADAGMKENEDLRGIFNAGHTRRTAFVIRCDNKKNNFEPRRFNVFCPKAIAAIRKLPDTWFDRGIRVQMQRKGANESVEPVGIDFFEKNRELRQKLLKWAKDNAEKFDLHVNTPKISNDRAKDNWRPLLTIAKALGGDWSERARQAMLKLEAVESEDDLGVELLRDIQETFENSGADKIFSKKLVAALNSMPDRPWDDFAGGKGLSTNRLARLLTPFGIKPKTIRIGADTGKGYKLDLFEPVFNRYIPPEQNVTTSQMSNHAGLETKQNVTQNVTQNTENVTPSQRNDFKHLGGGQSGDVTDAEKTTKLNSHEPASNKGCYDVTVCDESVTVDVTDENGCKTAPDKKCYDVTDEKGGNKEKKLQPIFSDDQDKPGRYKYEI